MADENDKETLPCVPAAPAAANMRFARAGYEAYARFTGGKTFDGRAMPTFDALEQRIKDAWAAAAMGIFAEASRGETVCPACPMPEIAG